MNLNTLITERKDAAKFNIVLRHYGSLHGSRIFPRGWGVHPMYKYVYLGVQPTHWGLIRRILQLKLLRNGQIYVILLIGGGGCRTPPPPTYPDQTSYQNCERQMRPSHGMISNEGLYNKNSHILLRLLSTSRGCYLHMSEVFSGRDTPCKQYDLIPVGCCRITFSFS